MAERDLFKTLDLTKGLLILLIVLGHNTLITSAAPALRRFIYDWHVFAFLLITFVVPFRSSREGFLSTRMFRYFVPFAVFFTVSWVCNVILGGGWHHPGKALGDWALALVIGSAELLDRASGARLFWFLPALMGLVLLRWAINRTGALRGKVLATVSIAGFLFSGLLPKGLQTYFPLGLPIALYALGPGLAFGAYAGRAFTSRTATRRLALVLSIMVLCLSYYLSLRQGTWLIIANFHFYDVRTPIALVNHAVLAIAATATLFLVAMELPPLRFLSWIGSQSLLIYLLHQLIFVPLRTVLVRLITIGNGKDWLTEPTHKVTLGLLAYVLTLAICLIAVRLIEKVPRLTQLITPRDWSDFRNGLGRKRQALR